MLVLLGFAMIAVFMVLIMTKKLTPVLALIIVPTVFGLFAGAGLGIGPMVLDSMKSMTSTAALLMFAIIYFGLMIDVGLFDPLVRFILRKLGNDPAKVVLGTAILAAAVSLDGDGSTTFILTTAAMLPVYLRLKMSPVVLTCVAGLANGTMNILPWGGPTARAATALKIDVNDVFVPMVPMPRPAPAKSPKIVGTMMSANTGVNFFVMISTMNTAIMANPSNTSTAGSFMCSAPPRCDAYYRR